MRPGAGCGTWVPAASELIVANVAQVQQIRDLLECVWPAALETAAPAVPVPDLGRGDGGGPGP